LHVSEIGLTFWVFCNLQLSLTTDKLRRAVGYEERVLLRVRGYPSRALFITVGANNFLVGSFVYYLLELKILMRRHLSLCFRFLAILV
jgi:hypothetical protein